MNKNSQAGSGEVTPAAAGRETFMVDSPASDAAPDSSKAAQVLSKAPPSSSSGEPAPAKHRTFGMKLTAKQEEIRRLRDEGKTRPQIAAELGISEPVVSKTITAINKKLGTTSKDVRASANAVEIRDPEKAAALIDAGTDPLQKVADAFREAGLPPGTSHALLKRLRVKYYGAVSEVKNLKTAEILELMGQKIHLALQYMDDKVMADASFRDLALGTTAMIEKRQLLRGEPTAIVSDLERKKLIEMMPLLFAEGKRRGLTLDGEVTEKTVGPA